MIYMINQPTNTTGVPRMPSYLALLFTFYLESHVMRKGGSNEF